MDIIFRKLKYHILFSCCCLISLTGLAQRQTENSFRSVFGPGYLVGYLAYVPLDYNSNPTKKFPLLIFLHGAGEKAFKPSDLSLLYEVKKNGPPMMIEQGVDFPFIVISPQCPFGDWDQVTTDDYVTSEVRPGEFVDEIVEKIKKLYRVDTNRIYITGLSAGGAGAWSYAENYPQKVAAAIPIAGWGDFTKVCDLASNNVAIWAFQGELDGGDNIKILADEINKCNPAPKTKAKATIYAATGHDAWTRTYDNTGEGIAPDNIYDWLMRQSKNSGSVITEYASENFGTSDFEVFPIPARDKLSLKYYAHGNERIIIKISDQTSEEVFTQIADVSKGENNIDFDITSIKKGCYFMNLAGSSIFQTKKIIIFR